MDFPDVWGLARALSSAGEHSAYTRAVTGSIPVAPTNPQAQRAKVDWEAFPMSNVRSARKRCRADHPGGAYPLLNAKRFLTGAIRSAGRCRAEER